VKPRVTIGDGAIIGGGSVVTKDVPAHEVWAGNPGRFMKRAWSHPDYTTEDFS
jgi:acetyltransferase-like isoleucine patch superfamily enzyme